MTSDNWKIVHTSLHCSSATDTKCCCIPVRTLDVDMVGHKTSWTGYIMKKNSKMAGQNNRSSASNMTDMYQSIWSLSKLNCSIDQWAACVTTFVFVSIRLSLKNAVIYWNKAGLVQIMMIKIIAPMAFSWSSPSVTKCCSTSIKARSLGMFGHKMWQTGLNLKKFLNRDGQNVGSSSWWA